MRAGLRGEKRRKEREMKRVIRLMIVLMIMLVSLGSCVWGYVEHDRGGGYDRDGGHYPRSAWHARGGDHDEYH
jgi:hypothetical protein